jgi:hypothetical protein
MEIERERRLLVMVVKFFLPVDEGLNSKRAFKTENGMLAVFLFSRLLS